MAISPRNIRRTVQSTSRELVARLCRSRSKATYIAVTGSSAKTTTAALLAHILAGAGRVKSQLLKNAVKSTCKTLRASWRGYDYVVLEIGTSRPGDIRKMSELIRPHVGIVTLVGLEHYGAFRGKEAVAREKRALIDALPPDGLAILNGSDPNVAAMAASSRARVVTFGGAGSNYSPTTLLSSAPGQLKFTLGGGLGQLELETRLTGAHNRLAVSAAVACALELGIPRETIVRRAASFEPIFGRCTVHEFRGGPTFIVDTAKAPFETVGLALDVLRNCDAPRRRFVLGHISDYAGNPTSKYRDTYRAAAKFADQVIFVGEHSHRSKATQQEIASGKFVRLPSVEALSRYIKSTAVAGEVILLKSASAMHLERVMLDWRTDVRCWPDACGTKFDCLTCGRYEHPFAGHRRRGPGAIERMIRGLLGLAGAQGDTGEREAHSGPQPETT